MQNLFFIRLKPASSGLQICSLQLRISIAGLLYQTEVITKCPSESPTFFHTMQLFYYCMKRFFQKSLFGQKVQFGGFRFTRDNSIWFHFSVTIVVTVVPMEAIRPQIPFYNEDLFQKRTLHCHKCFSFTFGRDSLHECFP